MIPFDDLESRAGYEGSKKTPVRERDSGIVPRVNHECWSLDLPREISGVNHGPVKRCHCRSFA